MTKLTGKKKPLSSLLAEAILQKGGVLNSILVRLVAVSNIVNLNKLNYLQTFYLFYYMLIFILKRHQYIDYSTCSYLFLHLLPSATRAEILL